MISVLKIKYWHIAGILLILNFILRLVIYFNTELFRFGDFQAYLGATENIANGHEQYLKAGNYLFAISYIGYFAQKFLGSLDWFFVMNCLLGTASGLIVYYLTVRITGSEKAGVFSLALLTGYTEFMVFSSVFYTPIIMIFLLLLFIMSFWYLLTVRTRTGMITAGTGIVVIYILTFFFKPELKYFPWFLIVLSLIALKKEKRGAVLTAVVALIMLLSQEVSERIDLVREPEGNIISNEFMFFGHTDYGGDGGEGSFVYEENRKRYEKASREYFAAHGISDPGRSDHNTFRREEIRKYITNHPAGWVSIQFKKFFRTFGVVPESASFRVLYSGLLENRLWLTSIAVSGPVALILLLFIAFFSTDATKKIYSSPEKDTNGDGKNIRFFIYIYVLLFVYYIIATIFYGHYQERYRLPLMAVFIIPVAGYCMAAADRRSLTGRISVTARITVAALFIVIWIFQAGNALLRKERLRNAIEMTEEAVKR